MKHLFDDFSAVSAESWKSRLEKDLKGTTFDDLSVKDNNNLVIHPFYTQEDAVANANPIFTVPDWSICESILVKDAKQGNSAALHALNNGASGISFELASLVDPALLLNNIELKYIYCFFKLTGESLPFAAQLRDYLQQQHITASELSLFVSFDPLAAWQTDNWENSYQLFLTEAKDLNTCCIDGSLIQNAGANSVLQLSSTLALANEYLNFHAKNNSLETVKNIHFTLSTDTFFYEQIAKLRAFRSLAALLLDSYQIAPEVHFHVSTSNIYRSQFDSYTNLLRDSIAGMAAVLGGCNSLSIPTFDANVKEPSTFSLRMSRNQQLIFKEESYLNKVADVAAGSYYLEVLTEQLATKAWAQFKELEQNGGYVAALDKGTLQAKIAEQAQLLIEDYKQGKKVLIGVNKYPNPTDQPIPTVKKDGSKTGPKAILLSEEIL